jgi:glycine cleavage system aminomethyltransferase T
MGFVPADKTEVGTKFEIDAGRATLPASIVPLPFYKAPKN